MLLPSKSIRRYFNPDPKSPDHAYSFSGGAHSNIIISSVIFTFIVKPDRLAWTVDYHHYNTTWGPNRGANLYIDLVNAAGGIIPGAQILTVVDHNHCTYGGAERQIGRGDAFGFPLDDDFIKEVVDIGLRNDVLDYDVGPC
jgi:hypothetical protein